ncbi:MAG TPA: hypothetical protein VMD02_02720, partial [Candidatus Omnitrophota bacterium]|nr:hypothetical protein [Candidatus Omnitrophota bacterium]
MILSTTCVIPKVFLQAVIAAADPPEVATKYASTRDAAKALLAEKPKVVAFGEVHPKWDFNYKSTKARFAESIVPELAASGIKDLVVEQISDDPAIGRELERYFTGKCELNEKEMPNFFADIDISDKADLLLMIKKCKESGIRVHAGGMTLAQETETVKQTDYSENLELKKKAMRYNGT